MKGERFYERASQKKKKKEIILCYYAGCCEVFHCSLCRRFTTILRFKKKKKCRWCLSQEGMKDSFSLCALGNVLHKEKPQ